MTSCSCTSLSVRSIKLKACPENATNVGFSTGVGWTKEKQAPDTCLVKLFFSKSIGNDRMARLSNFIFSTAVFMVDVWRVKTLLNTKLRFRLIFLIEKYVSFWNLKQILVYSSLLAHRCQWTWPKIIVFYEDWLGPVKYVGLTEVQQSLKVLVYRRWLVPLVPTNCIRTHWALLPWL